MKTGLISSQSSAWLKKDKDAGKYQHTEVESLKWHGSLFLHITIVAYAVMRCLNSVLFCFKNRFNVAALFPYSNEDGWQKNNTSVVNV